MPKTKYKSSDEKPTIRDYVFSAMLFVVIAIMPLIVRHAVVSAAPEHAELLGQVHYADFYAFHKAWVLGIPALVMAFYAISDWATGGFSKDTFIKLIKSPHIIAAVVFLFMALVSAIFSSYRHTSWLGTVQRYEGMLVLAAYFIVFFAAMHHARRVQHVKLLMYGLAFSSIVMGLIGFSQFIGRDFFSTATGARLIMGTWDAMPTQVFDIASGTQNNPNQFGKYTAMVAPILFACALAYDGRKWVRAIFVLGGMLMLVGVIGSGSVGGLIGIATAVMVAVITLACRLVYQARVRREEQEAGEITEEKRSIATWLIGGTVFAVLLVAVFFVPMVNQRISFLLGRVGHAIRREVVPTYDYIVDGDRLTVLWQDEAKFSIVLSGEEDTTGQEIWRIYDANGQPIPLVRRTTPAAPDDGEPTPFWPVTFVYDIPGHRRLNLQRHDVFTIVHGLAILLHDGRIHTLSPDLESFIDLATPIPAFGFEGNETWGSARGHIWSRTFPLMPRYTVIGSGPDTYTLVFPQHDVIGKMRFHTGPYVIVDKAHNLYLQTWITTGGVSALALIFLFAFYLVTSFIRIVRSRLEEGRFVFVLQFGLLAGISAFCMAAMATDSTIGTSGVFYLLLGLGFGLGHFPPLRGTK